MPRRVFLQAASTAPFFVQDVLSSSLRQNPNTNPSKGEARGLQIELSKRHACDSLSGTIRDGALTQDFTYLKPDQGHPHGRFFINQEEVKLDPKRNLELINKLKSRLFAL